jgi:hypothetical protein
LGLQKKPLQTTKSRRQNPVVSSTGFSTGTDAENLFKI